MELNIINSEFINLTYFQKGYFKIINNYLDYLFLDKDLYEFK